MKLVGPTLINKDDRGRTSTSWKPMTREHFLRRNRGALTPVGSSCSLST